MFLFVAALVPCVAFAQDLGSLAKIARIYDIEIVTSAPWFPVQTTHGEIDGQAADVQALEEYSGLFAFEFGLYPVGLVERSQLARVVLCQKLSFDGQLRNAIPDFDHNTLYLDVSRGASNKSYLRKVIHHEFFHIIDYLDDGHLYVDDHWAGLNSEGFQYGYGGKTAQHMPSTSVLTGELIGFLNHYSTTGVEEDKAELFANLVVVPEYVENRTKKDRILCAKVEEMRGLLCNFSPDMNEEFWDKVRNAHRIEDNDLRRCPKRQRSFLRCFRRCASRGTKTSGIAR
jgi:hypothetical protein